MALLGRWFDDPTGMLLEGVHNAQLHYHSDELILEEGVRDEAFIAEIADVLTDPRAPDAMVRLEQGGKEVKLSKRAGSYTTLRELFEMVGVDVARYFFLMRKPEAQLVFDLDQALDQSEKNPVFKVLYAHARMCSIFAKAGGEETARAAAGGADLSLLVHPSELALVKALAEYPDLVERAASQRAPHLVCDYLEQTAGAVNSWYHAGNPSRNPELAVLVADPALRGARLMLAQAVRVVLKNGLRLLNISAPVRMERAEEDSSAPSP